MQYINNILDHPKRATIERRIEIIEFCDEHGFKATKDAFGISRSTIYLWKQKLKTAGGRLSALAPGDRTPIRKRHRTVHPFVEDFIVQYRTDHPGADKMTITPALSAACKTHCVQAVSESTVGRIIHDLKEKGRLPRHTKLSYNAKTDKLVRLSTRKTKKTRRKGFLPRQPGDLVQMDTVSVFAAGIKRYIFTGIDVQTRFASPVPTSPTPRLTAVISSLSSSASHHSQYNVSRPITGANLPCTLTTVAMSTDSLISITTPSIPNPMAI